MFLINFWLVLVFLVAFWPLKQAKNEGEFFQTLQIGFQANKEMEGRESQKKSSNQQFRMAMRNLRMLCEIQNESSCKTNLEHFVESIVYIL